MVAILDWATRKVLSWRLSNSMDSSFCVEALKEALENYPVPQCFNTDQGSQFTSESFLKPLKDNNIKISMDGKGRALDNVIIERFWRNLKYEHIYLLEHESLVQTRIGISEYIDRYNSEGIMAFRGEPLTRLLCCCLIQIVRLICFGFIA